MHGVCSSEIHCQRSGVRVPEEEDSATFEYPKAPFALPARLLSSNFRWAASEDDEESEGELLLPAAAKTVKTATPSLSRGGSASQLQSIGNSVASTPAGEQQQRSSSFVPQLIIEPEEPAGSQQQQQQQQQHAPHVAYWRNNCAFHELFEIPGVCFVPYDVIGAVAAPGLLEPRVPVHDIYITMWPQRFFEARKAVLQALLSYMCPCPVVVESTFTVRNSKDREINRKKFFARVRTADIAAVLEIKNRLMFDLHGVWAIPPQSISHVFDFAKRLHSMELEERHCITCELPCYPLVIESRANRRCKGTCGMTPALNNCKCPPEQ